MSVIGRTAEDICSIRVLPVLTPSGPVVGACERPLPGVAARVTTLQMMILKAKGFLVAERHGAPLAMISAAFGGAHAATGVHCFSRYCRRVAVSGPGSRTGADL